MSGNRVLVIDDEKNMRHMLQIMLNKAGYAAETASDGVDGLDKMSKAVRQADLSCLSDPGEIEWIKRLAFFPRLVASSARAEEPHRLAFYLYDLASAFHSQWTRGNDSPHLRFIQAKDELVTAARLALIVATQQVISSGLFMLGVEAPESMR